MKSSYINLFHCNKIYYILNWVNKMGKKSQIEKKNAFWPLDILNAVKWKVYTRNITKRSCKCKLLIQEIDGEINCKILIMSKSILWPDLRGTFDNTISASLVPYSIAIVKYSWIFSHLWNMNLVYQFCSKCMHLKLKWNYEFNMKWNEF